MKKFLSNYASTDIKKMKSKKIEIEKYNKKVKLLKLELEQHFGFKIPTYIVLDIIEHEDYQHFCAMINLAVVNNRLLKEDGEKLKCGIKEMYNIKNEYDRFQI